MKHKLDLDGQISHMQKQGIAFNLISREDAKEYLENHNYFFRIKSYAKNYEKYKYTAKQGQYINLDFEYLKELSILDLHLRRFLLRMTLDIEHSLKIDLLNLVHSDRHDDGYCIVSAFFTTNSHGQRIFRSLQEQYNTYSNNTHIRSYTSNLVSKYHPQYPLWSLIEIITFGDFIQLYNFYYQYKKAKNTNREYLWSAKIIRNASAHNNWLLNNLHDKKPNKVSNRVRNFLTGHSQTQTYYSTFKQYYLIMDIISVCFFYNKIRNNSPEKQALFRELQEKVVDRLLNSSYFNKNRLIYDSFHMLKETLQLLP